MRGAPPTDPGVRNYRTGLLPWVMTPSGAKERSSDRDRWLPHSYLSLCCLPYPLQRTAHALSALGPIRVALSQVPLGQAPSLQRLRPQFPRFVRRLLRYYEPVRLPLPVHHRRTSIDFPMRPATPSLAGRQGISQVLHEVLPCMLGVFDSAGSQPISRYRWTRCCLPPIPKASAPQTSAISELNTQPARTPVNASPPTSRQAAHDSENKVVRYSFLVRDFHSLHLASFAGAFRRLVPARARRGRHGPPSGTVTTNSVSIQ